VGKPLKSEPRTWLWGETNPQRSLEEQAVEDVRNVEGGTKRAWEARDAQARETESACEWTPAVDVAMGDGTPRKVLGAGTRRAGRARKTL